MPGLPAIGTLSYNGYTFDGMTKCIVRSEPVRDEADRTQICRMHTIDIKAIVAARPTDATLETLRQVLSHDGGRLIFINKGFGTDLDVNGPRLRDVKWGPKSNISTWSPIGSQNACEVEMSISTCVPDCYQGRTSGVMAFNFEIEWSQDNRGSTRRTIQGYLEIAQTRVGKSVPDSADKYLSLLTPLPPVGYRRTRDRQLSKDKSRLDFRIVDTQIPSPNPLYPSTIDIRGRHKVAWRRPGAGGDLYHRGQISVEVETAYEVPTSYAWSVFYDAVVQRLTKIKATGQQIFLDELEVDEDIWGYGANFRLGYRVLSNLKDLVAHNALWTPIVGSVGGWQGWHDSLLNSAFNERGFSQLYHAPQEDAIIDLCSVEVLPFGNQTQLTPSQSAAKGLFANTIPPADQSWVHFESHLMPIRKRPVTRQAVVQDKDDYKPGGTTNANQVSTGFDYGPKGGIDDIHQFGGRSRYSTIFYGTAIRAGYPCPRPILLALGGVPVEEILSQPKMRVIGMYFGVPVYRLDWHSTYVAKSSPGAVKNPDDIKERIYGEVPSS